MAGAATDANFTAPSGPARLILERAKRLILGSSSPTRRRVLSSIVGDNFELAKAEIDEKAIRRSDPRELVTSLASAKADDVRMRIGPPTEGILICSDQVVTREGRILEKPETAEEAKEMIRSYAAGEPARTVGAIVVEDLGSGKRAQGVDEAEVRLKQLPESDIDALVEGGDALHSAGALVVEHELVWPRVASMEGSLDSVLGLGVSTLSRLLEELFSTPAAPSGN